MQDPDPDFRPAYGVAETIDTNIRRIVAPNPSPMTFRGTNTYLLGVNEIAVIDPGPNDQSHLQAILGSLKSGQTISHIFVSHAHLDHSPLARPLAGQTGAQIYAFGAATSGRSDVMRTLAASGLAGGGEGVDADFRPDICLHHGQKVKGDGWTLEALHTPGHMANHMCFAYGDVLFSADLVMGWASSLVSPPDGDLTQFMESCHALRTREWSVFHAGHGAPVKSPAERLDWLISHRQGREAQILNALHAGPATAHDLTARIYTEVPPALLPAAERNVLAHLLDLLEKNEIETKRPLAASSVFALAQK